MRIDRQVVLQSVWKHEPKLISKYCSKQWQSKMTDILAHLAVHSAPARCGWEFVHLAFPGHLGTS